LLRGDAAVIQELLGHADLRMTRRVCAHLMQATLVKTVRSIVIGLNAGSNLTRGNADIDIGNAGVAGERHAIRSGNADQYTKTFIAGIWGHIVRPGNPVFVGPDGSLGAVASSERYKSDIAPMGSSTSKISQLRPVTFHVKA
jgi:hypothetical protein